MIPNRWQRGIIHRIGRYLHPLWPGQVEDPVFVVGCPRSGTSIFGRILGQQSNFLYLHEPRFIWRNIDPEFNVWRGDGDYFGRLVWRADDGGRRRQQRLGQWLHLALTVAGQERLIEKMPLNVFRLEWLAARFPQATFIHVLRDGRDVALSLEKAIRRWFSAQRGYPSDYWRASWHYQMFVEYARARPALRHRVDLIKPDDSNYVRGLLVWACAASAGRCAGDAIGPERYYEVQYEALVQDPAQTLRQLFHFLGETPDEAMLTFAQTQLHGRSLHKPDPAPQKTKQLVGDLLTQFGYTD
jgi:hypothetical protein